jgi:hypothetical protein
MTAACIGAARVIAIDGVTPAGTPTVTTILNDKVWLAADPTSGTVYVTGTKFTFDEHGNYIESPIMVSTSSDFGAHFGTPSRVAPSLNGFAGGVTPYDQARTRRSATTGPCTSPARRRGAPQPRATSPATGTPRWWPPRPTAAARSEKPSSTQLRRSRHTDR